MDKRRTRVIARSLAGVVLLCLIAWIIKEHLGTLEQFTPVKVRDILETFGHRAAIVYIVAYALNTILPFPPLAILSLTAGLMFGKFWGAVYLMIGALLGASTAFGISRSLGKKFVERMLKGKIREFDDAMATKGFATILFFRVVPLIPHEILNYAAGLTEISFGDYFLATFLGLLPSIVISAYFGGEIGRIEGIHDLISFKFVMTALIIVLIIFIPVIYTLVDRKKKRRQRA
jgi:uncharacterized membrane protein YdjX (TVP38/TMEM64 family)